MNELRQILVVTGLSLRSLFTRIKLSLVIVVGLICVIVALLPLLAGGEGLRLAYQGAGDQNLAIVLSVGARRESTSSIHRAWVGIIKNAPGIARAADGTILADAEVHTNVHLRKKSEAAVNPWGIGTNLWGIGPAGFAMLPNLKLVSGRRPRSGRRELIVGVLAQRKFAGLELGNLVTLQDGRWRVVGVFLTGDTLDGDLIADSDTLLTGLRQTQYNSVNVRLVSPESFGSFRNTLIHNPVLSVTVERQSDYWRRLSQSLPIFPFLLAYTLGLLVATGAAAGTLNTMYAAVSSRGREIAILRAIGFGGFAVAVSVVFEAMLLAAVGAAIGTAIIWVWLDGYAYNGGLDGGVFRFAVTPHLLMIAIGWALAVALAGALPPAIQAARLTVVEALRAL